MTTSPHALITTNVRWAALLILGFLIGTAFAEQHQNPPDKSDPCVSFTPPSASLVLIDGETDFSIGSPISRSVYWITYPGEAVFESGATMTYDAYNMSVVSSAGKTTDGKDVSGTETISFIADRSGAYNINWSGTYYYDDPMADQTEIKSGSSQTMVVTSYEVRSIAVINAKKSEMAETYLAAQSDVGEVLLTAEMVPTPSNEVVKKLLEWTNAFVTKNRLMAKSPTAVLGSERIYATCGTSQVGVTIVTYTIKLTPSKTEICAGNKDSDADKTNIRVLFDTAGTYAGENIEVKLKLSGGEGTQFSQNFEYAGVVYDVGGEHPASIYAGNGERVTAGTDAAGEGVVLTLTTDEVKDMELTTSNLIGDKASVVISYDEKDYSATDITFKAPAIVTEYKRGGKLIALPGPIFKNETIDQTVKLAFDQLPVSLDKLAYFCESVTDKRKTVKHTDSDLSGDYSYGEIKAVNDLIAVSSQFNVEPMNDSGAINRQIVALSDDAKSITLMLIDFDVYDPEVSGPYQRVDTLDISGNLLAVDGNRDGKLQFDVSDEVTKEKPWRWWINDDQDKDGVAINSAGDIPDHSYGANNCDDLKVNGPKDLVDFFPIGIDVERIKKSFPEIDGYHVYLRQAEGAINVVPANKDVGAAFDYLKKESSSGYGFGLTHAADSSEAVNITASETAIPHPITFAINSGQSTVVLLVEGKLKTSSPIELVVKIDGYTVVVGKLEIKISSVKDMYRWISLRKDHPGDRLESPSNRPDGETSGVTVVFTHGYNVDFPSSEGWGAEMFKRFYQSGMRSKYVAVSWTGDVSANSIAPAPDYHLAVETAFNSSQQWAEKVAALQGDKVLVSHSLGAAIVGGAIQDCGFKDYSKYFAVDAAVPMESYNGSGNMAVQMIPPDWRNDSYLNSKNPKDAYDADRLWSANYYKKFTDSRNKLAWADRLGDVIDGRFCNMYSSGEEVLMNSNGNAPSLFETARRNKVWQSQEWAKGISDLTGVTLSHDPHGGWGFNTKYMVRDRNASNLRQLRIDETNIPLPVSVSDLFNLHNVIDYSSPYGQRISDMLNQLTKSRLIEKPFFKEFDNQTTLASLSDPKLSAADCNRLLSQAIPAITFAAGANPNSIGENYDLNRIASSWPVSNQFKDRTAWHHSDLKDVAYLYSHRAFDFIVESGGAK